MKDYSVLVSIRVNFTAKDEEQAEERGNTIAEAFTMQFLTPTGKPSSGPVWVGDSDQESVEVEEA